MTMQSMYGTFKSFSIEQTEKYTAMKFNYTNRKGELKSTLIFDKVFAENPTLKATIDSFKEGQPVEMSGTKNTAGYIQVSSVKAVDKLPEVKSFTGGAFKFKDNTVGQIKGNVATNAVTLAIARGDMDLNGMITAAMDVLALHKHLEALDIATLVGIKSATKTEGSALLGGVPKSVLPDTEEVSSLGALTNKSALL